MISPEVTTVTTTIKRYKIDSPANWKDVSDVLHQIADDPDLPSSHDDIVQVIARDDEIHFEFTMPKYPKPR